MRALAALCFLSSGASSLALELVWTRLFAHVFGTTTLALSTVVATFMAGLALGSHLASRWADRSQSPLLLYATAEVGVGIYALFVPAMLGLFSHSGLLAYDTFGAGGIGVAIARFLVSALVLLPPTTLMGATLPLLSRYFVRTNAEHDIVGYRVGNLYALNTVGAVFGAACAGFALLPNLGLRATNHAAAATHLLLGITIVVGARISRHRPRSNADEFATEEAAVFLRQIRRATAEAASVPACVRLTAIAAFGASGVAAMTYQILWTRALNMAIGSSTYAFTIVLCAFLIGLSAGAAAIGRLSANSTRPAMHLTFAHYAVVACAIISTLAINKIAGSFLSFLAGHGLDAQRMFWAQAATSTAVILPTTLALGGVVPLTIRVASSSLERVGRDVGRAYAANTSGAIAGAFCAGFVVLPLLQLRTGLLLACALSLAIAATLGWQTTTGKRDRGRLLALTAALAASLAWLPGWDLTRLSTGVFRPNVARDLLAGAEWDTPELVYYRDGISTTVSVEKWSEGQFSLKNNGKVDASTGDDMPTQIAVGLLPLLLHPRALQDQIDAALVGFASGVSAGSVLQHPKVRRLDVIELEPAILRASAFFEHVNHKPLNDPRLRLHFADGRNFLAAQTRRYDVVISEPSNPWIAGVGNLFSVEYFRIARNALRRDGIFCGWVQIYELSPRRIKSIVKAFATVFPNRVVLSPERGSSDALLIGSHAPIRFDLRALQRAFSIDRIAQEASRAKLDSAHDLPALTLLSSDEVSAYVAGVPANTDDNALIEFWAPIDLFNDQRYRYYTAALYQQSWLYGHLDGLRGYASSEDYAGLIFALIRQGKLKEALRFRSQLRPGGKQTNAALALLKWAQGEERESLETVWDKLRFSSEPPAPVRPDQAESRTQRLQRAWLDRDHVAAWSLCQTIAQRLDDMATDLQLACAYLAYRNESGHTVITRLEALAADRSYSLRRPQVHALLAQIRLDTEEYRKAVDSFERWIAAGGGD